MSEHFVRGLCEIMSEMETMRKEKETPQQKMPDDYTATERALHEMLTESTGVHILDSGGARGRYWQQNREVVDFRKMPDVEVDTWCWPDDKEEDRVAHYSARKNIFHFLSELLEYDEEKTKEFHEWAEDKEGSWPQLMQQWVEEKKYTATWFENTYNTENVLTQIIQFLEFEGDDGSYILLQIHNGCDVRGGYTVPRVFYAGDYFGGFDKLTAKCQECDKYFDSEDGGYSWLGENYDEEFEVEIKKDGVYHKGCGGRFDFW